MRAKESAEELLRRLLSENAQPNACYVLAAMLERKRILKHVKTEATGPLSGAEPAWDWNGCSVCVPTSAPLMPTPPLWRGS